MENIITCISLSERRYRRRSISFSELIWKPMHHCQESFDGGGAAGKRVHLLASFKRWRLTFSQARTDQSGYDSTITNTHTKRLLRQLHQLCTLRRLQSMKSARAALPVSDGVTIANRQVHRISTTTRGSTVCSAPKRCSDKPTPADLESV